MTTTRKCSVCGKQITEGYVFDGTDCFCSYDCAAEFFNGDRGCVEILLDEGERLIWMDSLPTAPHYKVGIGADNPNNFFYCDTKEKVFAWINSKVFQTINDWPDIETYNKQHKFAPIEVILFEPKNYYDHRRQYVSNVRKCDDIVPLLLCLDKSQKKTSLSLSSNVPTTMQMLFGTSTPKSGRERFKVSLCHKLMFYQKNYNYDRFTERPSHLSGYVRDCRTSVQRGS